MKLLTPQQMRAIDKLAIQSLGIPGIVLMENAAIQVVIKASDILKDIRNPRITIAAGAGNNGGDAFAVARHLLSMGHEVSVYSMIPLEEFSGDARINGMILKNLGVVIPILSIDNNTERLIVSCRSSDLVIDGLLGTGLNRDVDGIWDQVIRIINENSLRILSIDIASGVDGLTGRIRGNCIRADSTVTFYLPKTGMFQYPGASFTGELTVADIGIPYALSEGLETPEVMEAEDIGKMLPIRPDDSHKGTFGKILIIAGSVGMTGAACLSALSAYRSGTGLVRLAVPSSCVQTVSILVPEAVITALPEEDGHLCMNDSSLPGRLLEDADAVLVGPGLSFNESILLLLRNLVKICDKPLVIDADAINVLARDRRILEDLRCEAVITPHPAEMARLGAMGIHEVQSDRINVAQRFADEYGLTVVLKGAGTVIAGNDGKTAVNPTGNNGMATAGSGDVLAGMITSLIGQGLAPFEAAVAGVYLHGTAGDLAAGEKGTAGMIASDIVEHIPNAFKQVTNATVRTVPTIALNMR